MARSEEFRRKWLPDYEISRAAKGYRTSTEPYRSFVIIQFVILADLFYELPVTKARTLKYRMPSTEGIDPSPLVVTGVESNQIAKIVDMSHWIVISEEIPIRLEGKHVILESLNLDNFRTNEDFENIGDWIKVRLELVLNEPPILRIYLETPTAPLC